MSLVVDDDYVEAVREYTNSQCTNLADVVSAYIRVMNTVTEKGISEGTTAEALKEFVRQVETDIKSKKTVNAIAGKTERYCSNFIKKIDIEDKDLY